MTSEPRNLVSTLPRETSSVPDDDVRRIGGGACLTVEATRRDVGARATPLKLAGFDLHADVRYDRVAGRSEGPVSRVGRLEERV